MQDAARKERRHGPHASARGAVADAAKTPQRRARVVLLGASNLTRGVASAVETARRLLGAPLDIQIAAGHGRSYGRTTLIVVRSLPAILDSTLWQRLESEGAHMPTYALITDIGNDIMLGVEPDELMHWVALCVRRLEAAGARIVMTAPPMARIRRLGPRGYVLARTMLFPLNRLTRDQALERADLVHRRLRALAEHHRIALIDPDVSWYGVDPIHIRPASRAKAWAAVLSRWLDPPPIESAVRAPHSAMRWLQLRSRSPDRWWLFGRIPRGREQPCILLPDGTTISLR